MSSIRSASFDGHYIPCAFDLANTNTSFTHNMGRVPLEAFVMLPDTTAAVIYRGTTAWTTTTITLKSSVANVAVRLFLV